MLDYSCIGYTVLILALVKIYLVAKSIAMSYEEIGKAFVSHYYTTLQTNRENLQQLYADSSIMTFEGTPCNGKNSILQKLSLQLANMSQSLTFKTIQHKVTSLDCQPIIVPGTSEAVNVMVMGQLQTDEDPPHSFSQSFLLVKSGASYYIANEIFRMIIHD